MLREDVGEIQTHWPSDHELRFDSILWVAEKYFVHHLCHIFDRERSWHRRKAPKSQAVSTMHPLWWTSSMITTFSSNEVVLIRNDRFKLLVHFFRYITTLSIVSCILGRKFAQFSLYVLRPLVSATIGLHSAAMSSSLRDIVLNFLKAFGLVSKFPPAFFVIGQFAAQADFDFHDWEWGSSSNLLRIFTRRMISILIKIVSDGWNWGQTFGKYCTC